MTDMNLMAFQHLVLLLSEYLSIFVSQVKSI